MNMNTTVQNKDWQALAEAVRGELRECSWLLTLLGEQQKAILNRDIDAVLRTNEAIAEQLGQIRIRRDARLGLLRRICGEPSLPATASIVEVAPGMPSAMEPLFSALHKESRSLRMRIRLRAGQNKRILERTSAAVSGMIGQMRPASVTRTYGRRGAYHTSTALRGSVMSTNV